jgi:nucleotide-binding universal stress UspA family protein
MAGSNSGGITRSTGLDVESAQFTAGPLEVTHIVVPLDGSPFAERALPVAGWVAEGLGAGVHPVEVVQGDEEAEGAIRYLDSVARRHHATQWDVFQRSDVAEALAENVASSHARMACMATHGRDRSATLLGSVAAGLLDRSDRPVILVGPAAHAATAADAAVVVAVDGTRHDDALVAVALGWAAKLARRVQIVTVALPAPAGSREGASPREPRGPAEPERYVASLAARAAGTSVAVTSSVAYDPVSVRAGLAPLLDRTAALVVLGSRRPLGVRRMTLGSDAAGIVHDAPVPAVVVPLPGRA